MREKIPGIYLLAAVFVIAICGLVYELVAASLTSYLLGGSITHFSIVIGVFLTAMGVGSYITRFIEERLADAFIGIEIVIGLVGGFSAAVLLLTFATVETYLPVLVVILVVTGCLVGMEIPILIRILRSREALRLTVANVLALDYLGALLASVAFPLFLVPYLGLLRTSFLFGLINVAVAGVGIRVLESLVHWKRLLRLSVYTSLLILAAGLAGSGLFTRITEDLLYQDNILFARQTKYQRIIVTRWRDDIRLFIDGNLQFSSVDEHRYHEALVHPAMSATPGARRALILGGGDGMTAREMLKYPSIERVDLVDLDAEMIRLFRDIPMLSDLSGNALSNPRVHVHVRDAGKFLEESGESWDLILIDLPDPNKLSLARLYTKSFYRLCGRHLNFNGVAVSQATSPFYALEAFWCIVRTWREAPLGPERDKRFNVYPYHVYVPSFGDWGFVMASRRTLSPANLRLRSGITLKYLNDQLLSGLFVFPQDSLPTSDIQANRLDNQVLTKYYRKGWQRFAP